MSMFNGQRGDDVTESAPITKALLTMDELSEATLNRSSILLISSPRKLLFTGISQVIMLHYSPYCLIPRRPTFFPTSHISLISHCALYQTLS